MSAPIIGERGEILVTSLASMRRAIAEGATIRVLEHWQPQLVGTTRKAIAVQGNGYWFYGRNTLGQNVRMWAEYPKAAQLRFNRDGTVTFYPEVVTCTGSCTEAGGTEHRHSWTLRFEQEPVQ